MPVVPSVAMNAKASGAPEKFASTPLAETTIPRRAGRGDVTTAWAISVPITVTSRAVTTESSTLPVSPVAYAPDSEPLTFSVEKRLDRSPGPGR
ncbi:hypothetical protein SBADM41S_06526 [Streptomyces badius]